MRATWPNHCASRVGEEEEGILSPGSQVKEIGNIRRRNKRLNSGRCMSLTKDLSLRKRCHSPLANHSAGQQGTGIQGSGRRLETLWASVTANSKWDPQWRQKAQISAACEKLERKEGKWQLFTTSKKPVQGKLGRWGGNGAQFLLHSFYQLLALPLPAFGGEPAKLPLPRPVPWVNGEWFLPEHTT